MCTILGRLFKLAGLISHLFEKPLVSRVNFKEDKMKIFKVAQSGSFENLPNGTEVYSKLYRSEGKIQLLNRIEKKDIRGNPWIKYEAFFTNTGRNGTIDSKDISGLWQNK